MGWLRFAGSAYGSASYHSVQRAPGIALGFHPGIDLAHFDHCWPAAVLLLSDEQGKQLADVIR